MKKYQLQSISENGEVVRESEMELDSSSILILQYNKPVSVESVEEIHTHVEEKLKSRKKNKVLSLPHGIEVKIIEIN